jgi:pyruvate/2-oxoglutarate dehydrogenase complex dihydrolipoamide dehydrogenase (E3) component
MKRHYDAIVVGTGQSGPSLAARLAGTGMKTAIVERKLFGGTCVNTGCMPTKTLVASAYAAHLARSAAAYGVMIDGAIQVDMRRVKARKDAIVRHASENIALWLQRTPGLTVVEGHARFEAANAIRVNDATLSAPKIFVNVGGRALVPPIPGLEQIVYLTNSTILDLDVLPEHLIIVGGSYIGLEFAQIYRRFGARVSIVEKFPQLIGREDKDVSDAVLQILRNEDIAVELGAECLTVEKRGAEIAVKLDCAGATREIVGSHLLLAVGRVPNTDDLGLEGAGIKVDDRGYIVVDDTLCTSVPGIWAIGDCNGRGAFTHTSYNDYEIVADNILHGAKRSVRDRISAYGLFIDPPLGRAGLTDTEVRASGRRALSAMRPMTRVGRAVEKGETLGFMKISVDAETKQILGAAILGVGGDEAIHCALDVMYAKAPYTVLQRSVNIHPTVSELIPTLLGELKPMT